MGHAAHHANCNRLVSNVTRGSVSGLVGAIMSRIASSFGECGCEHRCQVASSVVLYERRCNRILRDSLKLF